MSKRDMFSELMQGIDDLQQERADKITLKTMTVERKPSLEISAVEILTLREKLHVSRPVFASMLRMSPRTLERWEQDKAKPDQGNATLLKLIEAYPDTLDRIAAIN